MDRRAILPWVLIIGLIMLVFVGMLVNSRQKQKKTETPTQTTQTAPQTTVQDLTTLSSSQFDAKIKENLDQAASFAKKWKSDARLVFVQVKLTSLTPDEGTEVFVFDSPAVADYHFTFTISQKSKRYIRALIPQEDYLGTGLLAIDSKYFKTNYVAAFQTAEGAGGKDFREKNLDWTIEINLSRGLPNNWLWYNIDYKAESGDTFSIKINPATGEITKEETPS